MRPHTRIAQRCATMRTMTSANYTPADPCVAELFARYKEALQTVRELKPAVREKATAELHAGVTVGQLANATGESDEVFRRIARTEGIDLKRPPTRTSFSSSPDNSKD